MEKQKIGINFVVVRIHDKIWILFEDQFIDHNMFKTQNLIIEVLSVLYEKSEFDVNLCFKELEVDNESL